MPLLISYENVEPNAPADRFPLRSKRRLSFMLGVTQQWQPGYPQTPQAPGYPQAQPQQGGFLSSLEHSGFGQALMMGAGFGIGDDLINSIF